MCTAISFVTNNHYFGRTLDLEYSYCETITVTPRNFVFDFRKTGEERHHYAIIGMAYVNNGYPLYYDAVNEYGLCMAGLNFPDNAVYFGERKDKINIAPFEFIPFILSKCKDVKEAEILLKNINLINENFSNELPASPLHWMISDKNYSITVESVKTGLNVYKNAVGVLTNNPPFDMQMFNLSKYRNITSGQGKSSFAESIELLSYSKGMGGIGLPGDLSSDSRFVRACFTKLNSVCGGDENSSVHQFFHIMGAVEQVRGCNVTKDGMEITIYTSCCNADKGIYYYTTYGNRAINAVDMHRTQLDADKLSIYPLITEQKIDFQN